jgi:hypothetical protein
MTRKSGTRRGKPKLFRKIDSSATVCIEIENEEATSLVGIKLAMNCQGAHAIIGEIEAHIDRCEEDWLYGLTLDFPPGSPVRSVQIDLRREAAIAMKDELIKAVREA